MSKEDDGTPREVGRPITPRTSRRRSSRRRRVGVRIIPEALWKLKFLAAEHPEVLTEVLVHLRLWADGTGIDFDAHARVARARFLAQREEKRLKRRLRRVHRPQPFPLRHR